MLFNILMTVDEYVTYKHSVDVLNDIIFYRKGQIIYE